MRVSVIIPAYNCAGDLKALLSSIAGTNLSDYELIVADDGSTDGTREARAAWLCPGASRCGS